VHNSLDVKEYFVKAKVEGAWFGSWPVASVLRDGGRRVHRRGHKNTNNAFCLSPVC